MSNGLLIFTLLNVALSVGHAGFARGARGGLFSVKRGSAARGPRMNRQVGDGFFLVFDYIAFARKIEQASGSRSWEASCRRISPNPFALLLPQWVLCSFGREDYAPLRGSPASAPPTISLEGLVVQLFSDGSFWSPKRRSAR